MGAEGLGLESFIPKYKKKIFSVKYKIFSQGDFFLFLGLMAEKFHLEIKEKNFFRKNISNFFLDIFFSFSALGLESALGRCTIHYLSEAWLLQNSSCKKQEPDNSIVILLQCLDVFSAVLRQTTIAQQ